MRFTSIASGSSGNSTYIGTERTHILVDVGVTMKAVNSGLEALELNLKDINGIFLTHEHIDHIRAVGTISRKYNTPIYGTLGTLREVMLNKTLGEFPHENLFPILPDQKVKIGDLEVLPFSIYHDAADPVGYRIETESSDSSAKTVKVAVATDMGHYDDYIASHLEDLDGMVIEANHDVAMLSSGPYPVSLKRRILSDHGHLSNANCGKLLDSVLSKHVKHVFLGHLSKENNLPDLALRTVRREIDNTDSDNHAGEIDITVAHRDRVSEIIDI